MQLQYRPKLKLPNFANPINGSTTTSMRQYLERSRARRALFADVRPAQANEPCDTPVGQPAKPS
jgi:hypothetical protein